VTKKLEDDQEIQDTSSQIESQSFRDFVLLDSIYAYYDAEKLSGLRSRVGTLRHLEAKSGCLAWNKDALSYEMPYETCLYRHECADNKTLRAHCTKAPTLTLSNI
jgi:hypothetical protein